MITLKQPHRLLHLSLCINVVSAVMVTLSSINPMATETETVFSSVKDVRVEDIQIVSRTLGCMGDYGQHHVTVSFCGSSYTIETCESASNTCQMTVPAVGSLCPAGRYLKNDCCGTCAVMLPRDFSCGAASDLDLSVQNPSGTCSIDSIQFEFIIHLTQSPTAIPTANPTAVPTAVPTAIPTAVPTATPTAAPTAVPTAVPTAIPTAVPTAVPTATPTAVPTAVPTVVPTVVPTAVPTVVPTSVPTAQPTVTPTAVPTAVPHSTQSPFVIITNVPLSTIAPKQDTDSPTNLPVFNTHQPTGVDTDAPAGNQTATANTLPPKYFPPEGEKEAVAVSQTITNGGLGIAALTGSAASPNIAMLSAISQSLDCMGDQSHGDGIHEESNLSFFLHPLRFRVQGSPHAGSIVGNISLSIVVALIVAIVIRFVIRQRNISSDAASAALRYPSCTEIIPMFLYGSILQSSLEMILYPRNTFFIVLSCVGLVCCIVFAYVVWKVGEPTHFAATLVDLQNPEEVPKWKKYFFGMSAWKSDGDNPLFVERLGIFFDVYGETRWASLNNGRYMVLEIAVLFPITMISVIRAHSFTTCAVKAFSMAFFLFLACAAHWLNEPFLIPFLNQLMLLVLATSLASVVLFGVGYLKEDMKTWEISGGYYFMTSSLVLAMVRVIYDVLMWLLSVRSNYRTELVKYAGDVWSQKDPNSDHEGTNCDDVDSVSRCSYKLADDNLLALADASPGSEEVRDSRSEAKTPTGSSFYFKSPTSIPYSSSNREKRGTFSYFPQSSSAFATASPRTPSMGSGWMGDGNAHGHPSDFNLPAVAIKKVTTPTLTPRPTSRPSPSIDPISNPIAPPRRKVSPIPSPAHTPLVAAVAYPRVVHSDGESSDEDDDETFFVF